MNRFKLYNKLYNTCKFVTVITISEKKYLSQKFKISSFQITSTKYMYQYEYYNNKNLQKLLPHLWHLLVHLV